MANEALRMDLFGPSPAEVMQARQGQNYDQAMAWGQVDPLRSGQISGAMAGQAFGQALGGALGGQDPAFEQAQRMQMAQRETEEMAQAQGISLAQSPQDYYKLAIGSLSKYGLANEANRVAMIAQQTGLAEREMKYKEGSLLTQGADRYSLEKGYILDKRTGEYKKIPGYVDSDAASPVGKIMADYQSGVYGKPDSPEAIKLRDAAIEKANRIPPPNTTTVEVFNDKEGTKNRYDWLSEDVKPILNAGRAADSTIAQTSAIKSRLVSGKVTPGFAYEFRSGLGRLGQFMGVSEETLTNWRANPNDAAILSSMQQQIVFGLASRLEGKVSAREIDLLTEAGPSVLMTGPGMYAVTEIVEQQAMHDQKIKDYALDVLANTPNDEPTVAQQKINDYIRKNPFTISNTTIDKIKRSYQILKKINDKNTVPFEQAKNRNSLVVGNNYIHDGMLITYKGKNPKTGGWIYDVVQ